jgi:hypothetical protein
MSSISLLPAPAIELLKDIINKKISKIILIESLYKKILVNV